ncbi:MAG: ABC transporter permease [Dethiosulfatibacter sp.]|nr:ABC transporter permease [Dethiosulfatibacter sp.]
MIKRVGFLFWFNIKSLLTDYKKMFLLFLLPLVILFVVLMMFNKDNRIDSPTEKIGIGIVDLEQTNISRMLISNITEEDTVSNLLNFYMLSLKEAESTLKSGDITAFIIIPEDFSTGLLNMENPPINIVYDGNNSIEFFIIYKTVESFSKYVNYVEICTASEYYALIDMGFPAEDAMKINDSVSFKLIMDTLGRKILFDSQPIFQFPSVSSMIYHGTSIFVLIMFYISTLCALDIIEEKKSRVLTRIRLSVTGVFSFYMMKILAYTALTTIWMCGVMVGYQQIFKVKIDFLLVTLTISAISFLLNAFYIGMSEIIKDKEGFLSFTSLFIVSFAFLGGTFFPVSLLPYSVSRLTAFSPNLIITKNIINLMYNNINKSNQLYMVIASVVFGIVIIVASTFMARKGEFR